MNDMVAAAGSQCATGPIRVESTQIVASITCSGTEHSLIVTAEAPSDEDAGAGVVRAGRARWARLVPAPTGASAPLTAGMGAFLTVLPEDLFVPPGSSEHAGQSASAPPLLRRVALGALMVLFVGLAMWSRRKPKPEPSP